MDGEEAPPHGASLPPEDDTAAVLSDADQGLLPSHPVAVLTEQSKKRAASTSDVESEGVSVDVDGPAGGKQQTRRRRKKKKKRNRDKRRKRPAASISAMMNLFQSDRSSSSLESDSESVDKETNPPCAQKHQQKKSHKRAKSGKEELGFCKQHTSLGGTCKNRAVSRQYGFCGPQCRDRGNPQTQANLAKAARLSRKNGKCASPVSSSSCSSSHTPRRVIAPVAPGPAISPAEKNAIAMPHVGYVDTQCIYAFYSGSTWVACSEASGHPSGKKPSKFTSRFKLLERVHPDGGSSGKWQCLSQSNGDLSKPCLHVTAFNKSTMKKRNEHYLSEHAKDNNCSSIMASFAPLATTTKVIVKAASASAENLVQKNLEKDAAFKVPSTFEYHPVMKDSEAMALLAKLTEMVQAGKDAPGGAAVTGVGTCCGVEVGFSSPFCYTYPFASHKNGTKDWQPTQSADGNTGWLHHNKCVARNKLTTTKAAQDGDDFEDELFVLQFQCKDCSDIPYSQQYRHLVDVASRTLDKKSGLHDKELNHIQALQRKDSWKANAKRQSFEALASKRKLATAMRTLDLHQEILQLLSEQKVPRIKQLLATCLKQGWSMGAVLRKIASAIDGLYSPQQFDETDHQIALLTLRLGGRKLLYALTKSSGIASRRTLYRLHISMFNIYGLSVPIPTYSFLYLFYSHPF